MYGWGNWWAARCYSRCTCCLSTGLRREVAVRCRSGYVRWYQVCDVSKPELKTQDSRLPLSLHGVLFYNLRPTFGVKGRNFFQWFSANRRDVICYRPCWKFRTASQAMIVWLKTSTWKFSLCVCCLSGNCRHSIYNLNYLRFNSSKEICYYFVDT